MYETTDKLRDEIDKKIAARESRLQTLQQNVTDTQAQLETAEADLADKMETGTVDEYVAAKKKVDDLKDGVKLLQERLETVRHKEEMTMTELDDLGRQLLADAKADQEACAKKWTATYKQIAQEAEEMHARVMAAGKVYEDAHKNLACNHSGWGCRVTISDTDVYRYGTETTREALYDKYKDAE